MQIKNYFEYFDNIIFVYLYYHISRLLESIFFMFLKNKAKRF